MTTETDFIKVHYSTGKCSQPATDYVVPYASLEKAKNAGLLSGYATGFIFVEDGSYFLDGRYPGFGWEFQPNAASVSVPA